MKTLERFLATTIPHGELIKYKLADCVPKPKHTTTFNSWMNPSKRVKLSDGDCQFNNKAREPTDKEARMKIV